MLSMLLAYDDDGNVIGTLAHMVALNAAGDVVGLVDFDAHERAGGEMTDVWVVQGAKGSKAWPEWLGSQALAFRVELEGEPGRKRAVALVHRQSGHRRERGPVEQRIRERIAAARGAPADIRDIVGGPERPLRVDQQGRTRARRKVSRPALPSIAMGTTPTPPEGRSAAGTPTPAGNGRRRSP